MLSQGDYLLLVVPVSSPGKLWQNIYPLVVVAAEASVACEVCLPIKVVSELTVFDLLISSLVHDHF